jgi:hypothetical protein
MNKEARRRSTIKVLIITPLIVVSLVLGGAFLGLALGSPMGVSSAFLGATLGTLGLFVSLPIVVKVVDRIVKQETAGS